MIRLTTLANLVMAAVIPLAAGFAALGGIGTF